MARPTGRRKPCEMAEARARLAKAEQFATVAALAAGDSSVRSAEASLLVDAGIAASDAICCARLGERSADGNHAAALDLLAGADRQAARHLRVLLGLKPLAQYDTSNPSPQRMISARRAATALLDAARAAATGSPT